MKDAAKIQLANLILSFLKDNEASIVETPKMIGTLNKAQGIKGFKTADIGNPVFIKGDRYIIYLESLDGKTNVEISYYKKTLSPFINFTDIIQNHMTQDTNSFFEYYNEVCKILRLNDIYRKPDEDTVKEDYRSDKDSAVSAKEFIDDWS